MEQGFQKLQSRRRLCVLSYNAAADLELQSAVKLNGRQQGMRSRLRRKNLRVGSVIIAS